MKEMSSGKWSQKGILKSYKLIDLFVQFRKKKKKKKANMQNPCSSFEFQQQFLEQHREQLSLADQ